MEEISVKEDSKSIAMQKSGITRKLTYDTLYRHLTKKQKVTIIDGQTGNSITVEEDDVKSQELALDKVLRITGDIKPDGTVTVYNNKSINITTEEFKKILEADRKIRPPGQTGEIIDVPKYRA